MKREGAVTIRDIARALGISHATVSRALAGHPKIALETKARVRATAEQLGYVVNASARTIRAAHSAVVGLVIPDIQNDFYATVAKRVADTLAARGFQLMLSVAEDDPERELRDVKAMVESRVAGVIVVLSPTARAETLAMLRNVRTVQLVRRHPELESDAVTIDDQTGVGSATRHLIEYGHRDIGFIGTTTAISSGRARLAGFEAAMREHRLDASTTWLGAPRPEFARQAISLLLRRKHRPTALVLGSSELTLGALQGLQSGMVRVPDELSLVGYGDPPWFSLVGEGITTVSLPVAEVASMAAALVTDGLEDRGRSDADAGQGTQAARAARAARATRAADAVVASVSAIRPTLVLRGTTRRLGRRGAK